MKKITSFLFSLLLMCNVFAYDAENLYLVGNATEALWNPGSISMTKVETNVFTWTGMLFDNSVDKARFKFLTGTSWTPFISCKTDVQGDHQVVVPGTEYTLYAYEANTPFDYAFQVEKSGFYTLDVDLNTMKMNVSFEALEVPETMYIVGNAANSGWDNNNVKEMEKIADGVFIWKGELTSENNENFYFLCEKGTWNKTIVSFVKDIVISPNNRYNLRYRPLETSPNDYKFKVSEPGIYTIVLDFNAQKMKFMQLNYDQFYVVGGATNPEGAWDTGDNAFEMTKVADGKFTWTGNMYHTNNDSGNPDPGKFKFLSQRSWSSAFVYNEEAPGSVDVATDTEYIISYQTYRDNKFTITETGKYKINVDLNTMKMSVNKIDLAQLHMAGDALEGTEPVNMTSIADGVFRWKGTLSSGNFKFFTESNSTAKAFEPTAQTNVSDDTYNLLYYANEDSQNGFSFTVTDEGNYIVEVDLNAMKMSIVKVDLTQLHIAGDALEGTEPISMTSVADGIFHWNGTLSAGSFKFLTESDNTEKAFEPAAQTDVSANSTYSLLYYATQASQNGFAFNVTNEGEYTIIADLNSMEVKVIQLNYDALKVIGSALNAEGTWNSEGIQMHKLAEGEFVYVGMLYNEFDGELSDKVRFKFSNEEAGDLICQLQSGNIAVALDEEYDLFYQTEGYDNKFEITSTGVYTVYVNLNTMKMKFMKMDKTALFIVGEAIGAETAMEEDAENTAVFTWKGELEADKDFYFLNYSAYASSSVVSKNELQQTIEEEVDYDLESDGGLNSYFFKVAEDGEYTVTVDLNTMKMQVEKEDNGNVGLQENQSGEIFTVTSANGSLSVFVHNGIVAEQMQVLDITGKSVFSGLNLSGIVQIENELKAGLYLVKVTYAGAEYTIKTFVK